MQVNLLNLTATQAVPNFDLHSYVSKSQAAKFETQRKKDGDGTSFGSIENLVK